MILGNNLNARFILMGVLLLSLAGCSDFFDLFDTKDKYYALDDAYKVKFKEGDILTYDNHQGTLFKLVVAEIKYTERIVSRKGSSGPYDHYEYETVYYDSVIFNPISYSPIRNIYSMQAQGHVYWEPNLYERDTDAIFHEQITLNSIVYHSVFKFSGTPAPTNNIVTWYYTRHYGFVAFELNNGQLFTLDIP